jgi:N-acetylmuramoyl-L-alanine amidase
MVRQIQKALAGAGLRVIVDGNFGPITEEAVREFQKKKGITPDGIVGPATLALLIPARLKKSRRIINEIIIHCTATPEGRECSVDEIRQWHKARGFTDIGYHYVIHLDGRVENGRDVDIAGAHCTGHNANSIGVCYVGGCAKDGKTPKDTRTEAQKSAIANLLIDLRKLYPRATIHGHRDFANKACPSFDATKEYRMF